MESVGFLVGGDIPGLGDAGNGRKCNEIVGSESFPKCHGGANVILPGHLPNIERFNFIGVAENDGAVFVGRTERPRAGQIADESEDSEEDRRDEKNTVHA